MGTRIYAILCAGNGTYLVCGASRSMAKRLRDCRCLLARGTFPNPAVQAAYDADPGSIRYHFLERCDGGDVARRKRHHVDQAIAEGSSLNRKMPALPAAPALGPAFAPHEPTAAAKLDASSADAPALPRAPSPLLTRTVRLLDRVARARARRSAASGG
jgi:hypothetical protein